jgi:ABC-type transport system involved in multi-copper enzyme maturation permease subunit
VVYGPQSDIYLLPLTFLGAVVSTLVWLAIVLALSSVTKSSVLTAVISVVVYIAVGIAASTVALFTTQSWFLTALPGGGGTGYLIPTSNIVPNPSLLSASVSTGTDSLATNLVSFVLHPSYYVEFVKENISLATSSATAPTFTVTSVEPLSYVLLTSLCVAFAYIFVFLFIAWFSLKRAEVSE